MYIILHTYMATPKSNRPKSKSPPKKQARRPQAHRAHPQPPQPLRTRFSARQLLRHFHKLLPASWLATWLAGSELIFYQRAFTPLITLWYLVFQRLNHHHRLSLVVADAQEATLSRRPAASRGRRRRRIVWRIIGFCSLQKQGASVWRTT